MIPLFLVPLFIGGVIQGIKLVIDFFTQKKFSFTSLRGAGGFPSVHSGIASSICTLVFRVDGVGSTTFALCIAFSFMFWYDAANVRYEAGQHASFLNKLTKDITSLIPDQFGDTPHILKERLGHTFIEVIGGIVIGIILTSLLLKTGLYNDLY